MFCPDENLGMFQIMIINVHLTMTSGQPDQAMLWSPNLQSQTISGHSNLNACQLNLLEQPKITLYEDSSP